ncbi:ubie coq5 [Phlyctema vagabunda]|uniref:Ubie coq5 n=1 Tax=Phlyctema vagabunda TaxID=108571 RepID=A0ABR4PYN2_9HELO
MVIILWLVTVFSINSLFYPSLCTFFKVSLAVFAISSSPLCYLLQSRGNICDPQSLPYLLLLIQSRLLYDHLAVMSTFAKSTFSATGYATFRPTYPPTIYRRVLEYHRGAKNVCVDLGCGHGVVSRELSPHFKQIIATDPSAVMVSQARSSSPQQNITFREASAEDLSFIEDGTLDLVVAGQAAHWFDYTKVWAELQRKLRQGGTIAFWGYKDNVFPKYPKATVLLDRYCYAMDKDLMGPFWEQPGRSILRDRLRAIVPPEELYEDVQRVEYEPNAVGTAEGSFGERIMYKTLKLGEVEGYTRTFSAFHGWQEAHPDKISRAKGGEGDLVDEMLDEMLEAEPEWKAQGDAWRDFEVETEWGSAILLARKK